MTPTSLASPRCARSPEPAATSCAPAGCPAGSPSCGRPGALRRLMAMMVRGDLGLDPWDVFHYGLAQRCRCASGRS